MHALQHFDFFTAVPLGGSATFGEISAKTKLPESLVRRIIKYAVSMRIFAREPGSPDTIVHTSLSATLSKNPLLRTWIRHNMVEARPATTHIVESIEKYTLGKDKESEDVLESGFALANVDRLDKPESFWDYLNRAEEGKPKGYRAQKFAEAMQCAAATSAVKSEESLRLGYDWGSLGEVTVVDVSSCSLIFRHEFVRRLIRCRPEVLMAMMP